MAASKSELAAANEQPQGLVHTLEQGAAHPSWLSDTYAHVIKRHLDGSLPHALLLSGPSELGKRWLAESLVLTLACRNPNTAPVLTACGKCTSCAQLRAGTYAEFRYLRPVGKSLTLKIDPIRDMVNWLHLSASEGRYRIALITGADTLNHSAANALLKTLEEPGLRSLLLLVADKPAQLPATLLSRCQKIPMSVQDRAAATSWLSHRLPKGIEASAALGAANEAPLRAIRESQPEFQTQQSLIDAAWWNLLMHKRSVGAIVESLKDVPLTVCLSRFMSLNAAGIRHRQGAGDYSALKIDSEDQVTALSRLDSVQWFTIQDQLQRLYRIDSASFKTQTVLEGFFADTRGKINR